MTLFLPRLKKLVVDIDGERFIMTRIVEADDALNGLEHSRSADCIDIAHRADAER